MPLPSSGAENSFSITVDGTSKLVDGQLDGGTFKQNVTTMMHKPLGTMDVSQGQDLGGWSGTLSAKPGNSIISRAIDIIEASIRLGIKPVITLSQTTRFPDQTTMKYLYIDLIVDMSGGTKRGEFDTNEINWSTGKGRVAL